MKTRLLCCLVSLTPIAGWRAPAVAADFYAGKTITFVASAEPGPGYDAYTRLIARHIGKFVPGAPATIVQNQPGGGGLRIAESFYSVTEKDGTKVGNLRASSMLDSILDIHAGQIDPRKYEWIGSMASDTDLCTFSPASGIRAFDDLRKKEVIVGASGVGAQNYSFPNALNHILGAKMKIIVGYKGMGDRLLAVERGELQGNCGINSSSMTSEYPNFVADGKFIPIVQSGLHPYSALPDVPLAQSFATTDEQKQILLTIFSQMEIARTFALPPGTPKDRVEILRTAFMQAMRDPQLIADAKTMRVDLHPESGAEVERVIADMANISPDMKAKVRAAIGE